MKRRRALDGLEDDIRDHISRETEDNIERGMAPAEARHAALRKFGNVTHVLEETRDVWRWIWIEQLLQDLGYSLRSLRRNPRFAAVAVLTLAVGIGMNAAVFSVIDTVLLKPLAYPNPERLVWLGEYDPNIQRDIVMFQDFSDWRQQARSYAGMAAYGYRQAVIGTGQGSTDVTAVYVAGDFWRITGAHAAAGRLFGEEEPDCVVLSWRLFERQFGADPRVVGQLVVLNGRSARIAGVLPSSFRFQFPMWWTTAHPQPVEAYVSPPPPAERMAQFTQVVAALKPGIAIGQAQAELESLEKHLAGTGGRFPPITKARIEPLQEKVAGGARRALMVLLAAGAFVLLIAAVNVANLLLARATVRRKEVAIRAAVGAGRPRVTRQLLAESVLLALAGGTAGLLLARWAIAILVRISPYAVPRLAEAAIDARVLAFTLGVSLLTGILFGAGPAFSLWRANLHDALKDGTRSSSGLSGQRTRRMLVAVELSLAIVLLTGAGLMLKSFARMNAHAPGFAPEQVIVMKVRFAGPQYREKTALQAYLRELLRRVEAAPGVQSAGVSTWFLFDGAPAFPADLVPGQTHVIRVNAASPGYLKALGMTLKRGRWLTDNDTAGALLNESMARQAFGAMDPIGRRLSIPQPVTIVGILADVKYSKLDAAAPPEVFVGYQQAPPLPATEVAVRAAGNPAALAPALRKLISDIDPSQPVYDVKTLDHALGESIAPRRFNLFLLGAFAASALLLAVVGIYGVMAYSVAERTREIGVRIALGARRGQVAAMVVREALPIAAAGIAAGLSATWALTRLMAALLYDVQATDPETFAVVAILLGITALAACAGPALRAASIDPTVALRYE
ncbi:MAG: ABC transporter permease [Bryobacteraceae bacterium]